MENNEISVPSSPSELFAMQRGGIKGEIGEESVCALRDYLEDEILPELNPNMSQLLVAVKAMVERLENFHFETLDNADLTPGQHRIWERDAKNITRALMALRQVAEG